MPPDNRVTFFGLLKYEAKQFCLNTALHGYRFIVLPKRILLERVFWVIIVLISLVTAVTLLCIAWNNFQLSPTLLVTDSTHHPIWNYPFPAVTICSYNKISKSQAKSQVDNLRSKEDISDIGAIDKDLATEFKLLFQLIFNNNDDIPSRNYTKLQDFLELNDVKVEEVMKELAPPCQNILQRCKWKGEEKRCESLFEPIATSEGFCCSFNYYALKNHTFAGTLANKIPKHPRRVSACGYLTALEVLVNSDPSDYVATQISSIGHRVLIHNAYDYPDWSIQSMMVEKGIISLIGINPTITYSTENIRSMDIEKRNCLFPDERMLHNFAQYSFHNCLSECRMNISVRLCGCYPFFYDNPKGTYPKRRICTLRDVACLTENRRKSPQMSWHGQDLKLARWGTFENVLRCIRMTSRSAWKRIFPSSGRIFPSSDASDDVLEPTPGIENSLWREIFEFHAEFRVMFSLLFFACLDMIITSVPGYDINSVDSYHPWGTEYNACGCLPDCEYVDYLAESSTGVFTRKYSNNQLNLFGGIDIVHQSVIRVYFNDLVATRNRKDVSFSWHTLLAYYGGLLGLFTGFSFVSAVELVYFFTIRLVSDSSNKDKMIKKKENNRQKMIHVKPPPYENLNPDNLLRVDDYRLKLRRRSHSNS